MLSDPLSGEYFVLSINVLNVGDFFLYIRLCRYTRCW